LNSTARRFLQFRRWPNTIWRLRRFQRGSHDIEIAGIQAWLERGATIRAVSAQVERDVTTLVAVPAQSADDVVATACFSAIRGASSATSKEADEGAGEKRPTRRGRREEADERVGIVVLRAMRARRDAYTVCAVVRIPLRRPQATARQCMAPQSMCAVRLRPR